MSPEQATTPEVTPSKPEAQAPAEASASLSTPVVKVDAPAVGPATVSPKAKVARAPATKKPVARKVSTLSEVVKAPSAKSPWPLPAGTAKKAAVEKPTKAEKAPVAPVAEPKAAKVKASKPAKAPKALKATKAATKVATKPAVKPDTVKAPAPVVSAPVKKVAAKVAKPVKADKVEKAVKQDKPAKAPKAKLVRDSFTMPAAEFALVAELKARALGFQRETRKSELLRAGLAVLAKLSDAQLKQALLALPPLKAGRPKKDEA